MTRAVRELVEETVARLVAVVDVARDDARHQLLEEMRAFTAAHPVRAPRRTKLQKVVRLVRRRKKAAQCVDGSRPELFTAKTVKASVDRSLKTAAKVAVVNRLAAIAEAAARAPVPAVRARRGSPEYKKRLADGMRASWVRRRAAKAAAEDVGDRGVAPPDNYPAEARPDTWKAEQRERQQRVTEAQVRQAALDAGIAADRAGAAIVDFAQAVRDSPDADHEPAEFFAGWKDPDAVKPPLVMVPVDPPRAVVVRLDGSRWGKVALLQSWSEDGTFAEVRLAAGRNRKYSPRPRRVVAAEIVRDATDREAVLGHVP